MDATTEPVIAVIGNPIAGNPAQFALERAFESMDLDWRVISFEVPHERIASALDGIEALQFRGLFADDSLVEMTSRWYAQRHSGGADPVQPIDCLYRTSEVANTLTGTHVQSEWLAGTFQRHFHSRGRIPKQMLMIGALERLFRLPEWDRLEESQSRSSPDTESVEWADLIILTDSTVPAVDSKSAPWPRNDASTLVIDLTRDGHPDIEQIGESGYHVISSDQRRVGTLLACIRHWTGSEPSWELVQDAIEEYLAV